MLVFVVDAGVDADAGYVDDTTDSTAADVDDCDNEIALMLLKRQIYSDCL
jgi:hypothetical protein